MKSVFYGLVEKHASPAAVRSRRADTENHICYLLCRYSTVQMHLCSLIEHKKTSRQQLWAGVLSADTPEALTVSPAGSLPGDVSTLQVLKCWILGLFHVLAGFHGEGGTHTAAGARLSLGAASPWGKCAGRQA